jgi:hypothetical protein
MLASIFINKEKTPLSQWAGERLCKRQMIGVKEVA